jgi:hypothetical protein
MLEIIAANIILTAFCWLLVETDYLRVRLPVGILYEIGASCQWHLPDDAVTDDMKQELLNLWSKLPKEVKAKFAQGLESPLCGWGYAYQYRNLTPECAVEMTIGNVRYNMTIKQPSIIKDVMRVNHLTNKQKVLEGIA